MAVAELPSKGTRAGVPITEDFILLSDDFRLKAFMSMSSDPERSPEPEGVRFDNEGLGLGLGLGTLDDAGEALGVRRGEGRGNNWSSSSSWMGEDFIGRGGTSRGGEDANGSLPAERDACVEPAVGE